MSQEENEVLCIGKRKKMPAAPTNDDLAKGEICCGKTVKKGRETASTPPFGNEETQKMGKTASKHAREKWVLRSLASFFKNEVGNSGWRSPAKMFNKRKNDKQPQKHIQRQRRGERKVQGAARTQDRPHSTHIKNRNSPHPINGALQPVRVTPSPRDAAKHSAHRHKTPRASFPLRAWVPPPHRPFQPRLRVSAPALDFRQEVLTATPIAGPGPRGVELGSASAPCPTFMATLSTCTASVKDLNKSGERQRYEGESWENKELGDEEKDPRTGGSVGKREIRRGQGRGRMKDQGGSEGRIRSM
ncbi:hypothetical protein B0H11DRAFT_2398658 [Mycena galericulata]|nr:hypothetical protein B0H11DRAFT_2398658 [Mycena galericulata]